MGVGGVADSSGVEDVSGEGDVSGVAEVGGVSGSGGATVSEGMPDWADATGDATPSTTLSTSTAMMRQTVRTTGGIIDETGYQCAIQVRVGATEESKPDSVSGDHLSA